MNRLNNNHLRSGILVLALLLLTVFLASCGDDDPVAPVVTNHAPTVPAIDTASGAPADGATDIPLTPQLHWTCTDSDNDPLTYTVHFGTAAQPPVVAQDQTAVSYTPSGLTNGITYYWMVVASDDNEKTTNSPIWSFTTLTVAGETVTSPSKPSGPISGAVGETLAYTTTGGSSSEGHPLEYRFDWGDGTYSDWGDGGTDSHAWASGSIYNVRAQARCQVHPAVESLWSLVLAVSIDVAETISRPGTPSGEINVEMGVTESYSTNSATSSQGHVLEYRFDWNDGTMSDWAASLGASHAWVSAGAYEVKVQARCQEHTDVESLWSLTPLTVTVLDSETISTPDAPSGPTTGETTQDYLRYDLSGAESSWGHTVEYQIDWGDGQMTSWSPNTFAYHYWLTPGTYEVKTQARCQEHPAVESAWSTATTVIISALAEVISVPSIGGNNPSTGGINDLLEFNIMPGASNLGHPTEVQIDWGDGTFSDWGPKVGMYYTRSHAWTVAGTYQVKAHARCIEHPEYESDWSQPKSVEIAATEIISTPTLSPSSEMTYNLGTYVWMLAGSAESNMGHTLEYQFDWGNGTMSEWSLGSGEIMPTDTEGDFLVRAHARCAEHPDVVSDWSATRLVHIVDMETISWPTLSGPYIGTVGELLTFTVSGAESSFGHDLEYQLYWSNGGTPNPLGWTTADNLTATFDQPYSGGVTLQVQARCIEHPEVESLKSLDHIVLITP